MITAYHNYACQAVDAETGVQEALCSSSVERRFVYLSMFFPLNSMAEFLAPCTFFTFQSMLSDAVIGKHLSHRAMVSAGINKEAAIEKDHVNELARGE